MNNKTKIKEIVKKIKTNTSVEQNSKLIKELFSDDENLKCLYNLISSDNNYEYLDLAKRFYIEIPDTYIVKSLKYKNNTTPANYFLYFSMYAKKLIKDINEVRKHFDKKLVREAENKCLNSWISRDRHELRKRRMKSHFAPENELEEIYNSISIDEFDYNSQRKSISSNFDYSLMFSVKDIKFNCIFGKEGMIVLINLDSLIYNTQVRIEPEKEEMSKRFKIILDDFYNSVEDQDFYNERQSKILKTPNSSSPLETKYDFYEFKKEIKDISFPTDSFFRKIDELKERNRNLLSDKFLYDFDKVFDNRIYNTKSLIIFLRRYNIKFYCFSRAKISNIITRFVLYGFDFLKKDEIFIQSFNCETDGISQLFEKYQKAYFFGMRDRVYDSISGRTSYSNINRSVDFIEYVKKRCNPDD